MKAQMVTRQAIGSEAISTYAELAFFVPPSVGCALGECWMVVHTDKLVLANTHEAMELNYFKTTHLIRICEDSFDLN